MDFLHSFQFWFGLINTGLLVGGIIYNFLSHQKIVGNDLHHLSEDVRRIYEQQELFIKTLSDMKTQIAVLEEKTKSL